MILRSLVLLLVILSLGFPVAGTAQDSSVKEYYSFHPMSTLSLGVGFSPNDLSKSKIRGIEFTPYPNEKAALKSGLSAILVRDSLQLRESLGADLSIDASYLAYKGGVNFSMNESLMFSSNSYSLVVTAYAEYGRLSMKSAKLTPEAQRLIDELKMKEFEEAYGTRFVSTERRGSSVHAVVTITEVSKETQRSIDLGMHASGGWGPVSMSVQSSFESEMARAAKTGRLDVQVVATGGQGLSGFSKLVNAVAAETASIEKIQSALGGYMEQFTFENSAPIGFHTTPMSALGYKPDQVDLWSENKDRRLGKLVSRYRHILALIESADSIIADKDPRRKLLSAPALEQVKQAIPVLEKHLDVLAKAHVQWKQERSSDGNNWSIPPGPEEAIAAVPSFPERPIGFYVVKLGDRALSFSESYDALDNWRSWKIQHASEKPSVTYEVYGSYVTSVQLFFDDKLLNTKRNTATPRDHLSFANFEVTDYIDKLPFSWSVGPFGPASKMSGTFRVRVKDAFGRETQLDLATADIFAKVLLMPFQPNKFSWSCNAYLFSPEYDDEEIARRTGTEGFINQKPRVLKPNVPAFNLRITRSASQNRSVSGYLAVNGRIICYTLERPWIDNINNISSIPAGTYAAHLRYDKADHWRVELDGVPGRTFVQIHIGNEPQESLGCILVGMELASDLSRVIRSTEAYSALKKAFYTVESPSSYPDWNISVTIVDVGK